uniref:DNA gyrase inhibitor YacG n=1 Tax=Ningiella ruwaisensis TaxID=2364274 RepID=UPI00109F22CF|nr:DNA gyrase inhibitor YacG [Ningiella ruwaisensis]
MTTSKSATQVTCPTCKSKVIWDAKSPYRPFCSKRCQLIDLGQWANEENAIPAGKDSNAETEFGLSADDIENIEAMLSQQEDDFFKS